MSDHVLDRLSAFLDEELPAREQATVEGHLRDCSACASHLDLLRSVDAEARALPVPVPDGYFDTLPGRIRGRLEETRRPDRGIPVWTWALAAALVLGVVTPLTMQRSRLETPGRAVTLPSVTHPAPTAAVDTGAVENEVKKDGSEPKLREEIAGADQSELRAAAPPPAATARLEPPAKGEADELQDARERSAPAVAPRARPSGPGGTDSQQQASLQGPEATAFAEAPVEAPAAAPPAGERRADAQEVARDEGLVAKRGLEAPRPQGSGGAATAAGRVSSAVASSDEKVFRILHDAMAPATLASLRERREAWRSFTRDFPSSPRADEARVRVIETGAEAWRMGGDSADLSGAREDAAAYLAREDAAQVPRVRAVLEGLPTPP
jgi:Putative zinc-finger